MNAQRPRQARCWETTKHFSEHGIRGTHFHVRQVGLSHDIFYKVVHTGEVCELVPASAAEPVTERAAKGEVGSDGVRLSRDGVV